MTQLLDRGIRILCVYTAVNDARYNRADQLFEVFPELRGRVETRYFPNANHVFTEVARRRELVATVIDWIKATF
jgi:hypothetical protein